MVGPYSGQFNSSLISTLINPFCFYPNRDSVSLSPPLLHLLSPSFSLLFCFFDTLPVPPFLSDRVPAGAISFESSSSRRLGPQLGLIRASEFPCCRSVVSFARGSP